MQRLCEEINDMVQEAGQVSLADLSRNFNLPINILVEVCYNLCVLVFYESEKVLHRRYNLRFICQRACKHFQSTCAILLYHWSDAVCTLTLMFNAVLSY